MDTPISLEYHHYQRQLMVVNCTGLAYQPNRILAHLSMPPHSSPLRRCSRTLHIKKPLARYMHLLVNSGRQSRHQILLVYIHYGAKFRRCKLPNCLCYGNFLFKGINEKINKTRGKKRELGSRLLNWLVTYEPFIIKTMLISWHRDEVKPSIKLIRYIFILI